MKDTPAVSAYLDLLNSDGSNGRQWKLAGKTTYRVGRDLTSDINLSFSWISRKHAMIQVEENGGHYLIDLGSANGTFVNGKRIYTPVNLKTGDLIKVGNTSLSFRQEGKIRQPAQACGDMDDNTVAFVQKKIVTILICDIHDYTRLSELLADNRISELLQFWSGKVNTLVRENEGVVDKFIGDAVMAVWAGAQSVEHSIMQALKTAYQISVLTRRICLKIPDLPWELKVGAAVNTGEAMMGNIGVDGRRDFTVVGDMVNVAFRLESLTSQKDGLDLIMGSEAATYLTGLEQFFSIKEDAVKGRKEPVLSYGCSFSQLKGYLHYCFPASNGKKTLS